MKKLTAMLLALCMLLAIVPATGEDFTGTWYWALGDVNIGTIILNADGTASVEMTMGEESLGGNGTWEETEGGLTVTIDGDALPMTYDAETGTLMSALMPIPMVREPGRYPISLVMDVMQGNTGNLPEGVTAEEVQAAAISFAMQAASLSADTSSETESEGGFSEIEAELPEIESAAVEMAAADLDSDISAKPLEGDFTAEISAVDLDSDISAKPSEGDSAAQEVTVLQENFHVMESYNGFRAYYFAKLRNNTGAPLFLTGGALNITDTEGNALAENKYLNTRGSTYLEPGEVTFVSMMADLTENVEVKWEKTLTVEKESYYSTDNILTVADPVYVPAEGYNSAEVKATLVNDSDNPLPGIEMVFALEDAGGNILYLTDASLYRCELGPHSTITMSNSIPDNVIKYCEDNGLVPAAVEALARNENKD